MWKDRCTIGCEETMNGLIVAWWVYMGGLCKGTGWWTWCSQGECLLNSQQCGDWSGEDEGRAKCKPMGCLIVSWQVVWLLPRASIQNRYRERRWAKCNEMDSYIVACSIMGKKPRGLFDSCVGGSWRLIPGVEMSQRQVSLLFGCCVANHGTKTERFVWLLCQDNLYVGPILREGTSQRHVNGLFGLFGWGRRMECWIVVRQILGLMPRCLNVCRIVVWGWSLGLIQPCGWRNACERRVSVQWNVRLKLSQVTKVFKVICVHLIVESGWSLELVSREGRPCFTS